MGDRGAHGAGGVSRAAGGGGVPAETDGAVRRQRRIAPAEGGLAGEDRTEAELAAASAPRGTGKTYASTQIINDPNNAANEYFGTPVTISKDNLVAVISATQRLELARYGLGLHAG